MAIAAVTGGADNATPMDPDNAGPDGTRAVARVLDDEGVDVDVARDADELEAIAVGSDTSVVVVLPSNLGQATVDRLLEHTSGAAHVIVLGADIGAAEAFGATEAPSNVEMGDGRAAGCVDPLFDGLTVEVDTAVVYEGGDCFPGDLGALVLRPRDGLLLFGADQAFTNDQVLRADNAAVALRLLGQDRRLVWYVPSLADLSAGEGVTLTSLLPRWIFPGLWAGRRSRSSRSWSGGAAGWAPSPPSRCPSSYVPSRPRAASGGCTVAPATVPTRPPRCGGRLGRGAPSGCGSGPGSTRPGSSARWRGAPGGPRPRSPTCSTRPPGDPGPTTDRDLIALAQALAELDREVSRP